jgi:putative spermidine/putrescine transport system substrate-binding protein
MKIKSLYYLLAISLLLTACAPSSVEDEDINFDATELENFYLGPVSEGEGKLNILAWPGYVESGLTDPLIDWVSPFQEETGCQVTFRPYSNAEEALSLTQNAKFDVVATSSDILDQFISQGLVQRINTNLLLNYSDLYEDLRKPNWATIDGKTYAVAQGRSFNSYVYKPQDFTEPVSSSDIFWQKPELLANPIAYDLPIYIADAALYLSKTQSNLGIKNIYSLDANQFNAVIEFIKVQRSLGLTSYPDSIKAKELIQASNYSTALIWQSIYSELKTQSQDIEYFVPSYGTTGWINSWVIMKDVQNINCAYKWIDWVTSQSVNASISYWFGEAPANSLSCEYIFDEQHCNKFNASDLNFWKKINYWRTPTTECLDGRTDIECIPYEEWIKSWTLLNQNS